MLPKLLKNFPYHQPDFYHFSEDSIWLAECSAQVIARAGDQSVRILDVGAGCGVVGLETIFRLWGLSRLITLDFCEAQASYWESLSKNQAALFTLLPQNISFGANFWMPVEVMSDICPSKAYDCAVVNPPYFFESDGHVSKSLSKRLCRFTSEEKFFDILNSMIRLTKVGGKILMIYPSREKTHQKVISRLQMEFQKIIRATVLSQRANLSVLLFEVL